MSGNMLIRSLIGEFRRGISLIERLKDSDYTKKHGERGSVGEHFRHNLEFGTRLLEGIKTGKIDYVNRARDSRVELERVYAIERFELLIEAIEELGRHDLNRMVEVRSEVEQSAWLGSSIARELEFLHSHTVHHYALIASKLESLGIETEKVFGVAPSTREYWDSLKKATHTA